MTRLNDLKTGQSARVTSVGGSGALRQHFLDMGLIPESRLTLIKYAPMGDPLEVRIHDYELSLRLADAAQIEVELIEESAEPAKDADGGFADMAGGIGDAGPMAALSDYRRSQRELLHPGFGEEGKYHDKSEEPDVDPDQTLTFALAGNQNCGKTTLFNALTGSNQHVGNFPGVTVDQKSGQIKGQPNTLVVDLPGIYSLSPYSSEEIISRNYIIDEKPSAIINIVDATNIERNLYLTMQLLELNVPVVVALNMMDEVRENHGYIDINQMEHSLGVPVVPISAMKNEGIDELVSHAVHIARYQEKPLRQDFCDKSDKNGAVHRCIHGLMHLIEDHCERAQIPLRFAATKLAEGDERIAERLDLDQNERQMIGHTIRQLEEESGLDHAAAIADMRYRYILRLVAATVTKPKVNIEHERSVKMDRTLTGKYTAIPVFIGIMLLIFYLTFGLIGPIMQGWLEKAIDTLAAGCDKALTAGHVSQAVRSLIINGIFAGVGSVISFVPIIVVLFFFLSILEDSGYMARVAFVTDKLLRKLGLSGRSIVPMLIGFGCSVPAVMASRTLPSARDRKMTIMLTPFMSCSAKLPIYGFFAAAFFPHKKGLIISMLYLLGIIVGILVALLTKNTTFKGEAVPFVMELPNYRMPAPRNVARLLWDKAKDFLQRAFTIIMLATIVVWFLQSFDFHFHMVTNSHESMLAVIAGWIAPVFKPLGFGNWQFSTALITGFIAKESVVATLGVLFGSKAAFAAALTPAAAIAILVFCLLYTPCVAAIAAVRRELGSKWALIMVIGQCVIAWLCALIAHLIFIPLS